MSKIDPFVREKLIEEKLGRYEFKEGSSDKFWQITFDIDTGDYLAEWGRNGSPPQDSKVYPLHEALKKINEKVAKGYQFKGDRAVLPYNTQKNKEREMGSKMDAETINFMKELKKLG